MFPPRGNRDLQRKSFFRTSDLQGVREVKDDPWDPSGRELDLIFDIRSECQAPRQRLFNSTYVRLKRALFHEAESYIFDGLPAIGDNFKAPAANADLRGIRRRLRPDNVEDCVSRLYLVAGLEQRVVLVLPIDLGAVGLAQIVNPQYSVGDTGGEVHGRHPAILRKRHRKRLTSADKDRFPEPEVYLTWRIGAFNLEGPRHRGSSAMQRKSYVVGP